MTVRLTMLSELCSVQSGGTPSRKNEEYWGGTIPWAKISDLEASGDGYIQTTEENITEAGLKAIRGRIFDEGTLLFAMYGSVGKTAIVKGNIATNQAILGIKPQSEKLDLKYLRHWLASQQQKFELDAQGVAQKNLSAGYVRELEIPIPPLPEQKRIAAILDKANAIRRKRQQAIQLADEFLRSVFLDMFGDPVTNPMGWEVKALDSLVSKPITYGILKPEDYIDHGIPMLRIQDLKGGALCEDGDFHLVSERLSAQYKRTVLVGGEIVISLVGTVGLVARVPASLKGANVHRNLGVIQLRDQRLAEYVISFMQMPQFMAILDRVSKGGVHKLLNLADLKEVEIPIPKQELIEKFSNIKGKIFNLTASSQSFSNELLFESLSQKAFAGQL